VLTAVAGLLLDMDGGESSLIFIADEVLFLTLTSIDFTDLQVSIVPFSVKKNFLMPCLVISWTVSARSTPSY
jgi:hypothetical protein